MYHCYVKSCTFKSSDAKDVLYHSLVYHCDSLTKFSLRHERLHPTQGYIYLQSVHFDIELSTIQSRIDNDQIPEIDIDTNLIRFKRKHAQSTATLTADAKPTQTVNTDIYELIPGVIEKICELELDWDGDAI